MRCGPETAPTWSATHDAPLRIGKRQHRSEPRPRKRRSIAATELLLSILGQAQPEQVTRRPRESTAPTKLGPCTTRTNAPGPKQTTVPQCTPKHPADIPNNLGKL